MNAYLEMMLKMEQRNREIHALRKSDPDTWTLAALATRYKISRQRVNQICQEQGGKKRARRRRINGAH